MALAAWKARRFSARAKRVFERHKANPAVATYASIVVKADNFAGAYDAALRYAPTHKKEFGEGRSALTALVVKLRTWAPVMGGHVVGFKESEYGDNPEVADDTLGDAERMLDIADDWKDEAGAPLAFLASLHADLDPALALATKECAEAEAADVKYQDLLRAQRESLALFDEELQRFRRTLMGLVGRSHKDYQKLRTEKGGEHDEDDDGDAGAPPPTTTTDDGGTT